MPVKKTTNAPARKGGKHIEMSSAVLQSIFDRIGRGESVNQIMSAADMPSRAVFYKRIAEDEGIRAQYQFALDLRADWIADDLLQIADSAPGITAQGSVDSGDVAHQKLRVDTRKWLLSKMSPKKYGEKVNIDANVKSLSVAVTEEQAARIAAEVLRAAGGDAG